MRLKFKSQISSFKETPTAKVQTPKGSPLQGGLSALVRSTPKGRGARGSATFIVVALLSIISTLLMLNSTALSQLKREIDWVERKQLAKFPPPPAQEKAPAPDKEGDSFPEPDRIEAD